MLVLAADEEGETRDRLAKLRLADEGQTRKTHSEIRHADKLITQYGDGTDGANLWFVKGVQ